MTHTAIYLLVFALVASALVGVAGATAPNPTYGAAVVDGSTGDWDLGSDLFANMYRAGNPAKPLESKAYLRYDCTSGTVYVLVLSENGVPTLTEADNAWVKINGGKAVDGTYPDFAWVAPTPDGNNAHGYEASFPLAPGTYSIDIHVQVYDDNEEQTSRLADVLSLVLVCNPPTTEPTTTAPIKGSIAGSKWRDLDGNRQWDAGEPGLGGWTIYLEVQESGSTWVPAGQTTTDANGAYSFTDLSPGQYRVSEALQSGWIQTYPAENAGMHNLAISADQSTYVNQNFGNRRWDDGGGGTETPTTPPTTETTVPTTETTVPTTETTVPTTQTTEPTPTVTDNGGGTETPTPTPTTPPTTETTVPTTQTTEPTPTVTDNGGGTETPTPTPTVTQTTTVPTTTTATPKPTKTPKPTPVSTTVAPTPTPTFDPDLCPLDPAPTGPVTTITGPTVITEPGFYALGADAFDTNLTVWLDIRVSDVNFDGMGHTIDGIDEHGTYGIRARGESLLSNVTIRNVTVTDFAYGIGLFDVNLSRIARVSATSNTYDGIMVVGGGDNRIQCSVIHQDDDGINMTATNRTLVANNIVTENFRGSGIHLSQGCDEVTLLGNIIRLNDEGIEIEDASNSTIRANRVSSSRYYGLNLTTARNLTVVDNYFNNRENIRFPTGPFTGIWSLPVQAGPNVIGGLWIGGNYWGTPDHTGFSDVTPDWNGDGFVDSMYVLPGGIGTDRLPLAPSSFLLTYGAVPAPTATFGPVPAEAASEPTTTPGAWSAWKKTYPIGDGLKL